MDSLHPPTGPIAGPRAPVGARHEGVCMRHRSSFPRAVCGIGFACLASAAATAAEPATALLAQSAMPFAANVTELGAADPASTVSFQVALRLRDEAALDAAINRGERLSATDLAARHWPAEAAYQAVRSWLTSHGLTVDRDAPSRLSLEVHGTAAQVAATLGVAFARVSVDGQQYVASAQAPSVPAELAPFIESINGLQPYQHMSKVQMPSATTAVRKPSGDPSPNLTFSGDYLPGGISRAYQASGTLTATGSGTRTAILIDTLPNTSDLTAFWKLSGIQQTLSDIEFEQVGTAKPAPSGEETLDTEWASSMAPGSIVRVYATGTLAFTALDTGFEAILADIKNGTPIQQLSISLGACETAVASGQVKTDNNFFRSLAAQGVSVFVSTGDSGAKECGASSGLHPAFYSTSPFVLAVGATHLIVTAASQTAPVTIKSETAWTGSGGGVSRIFAKPSWQSSLSYPRRAVPDVAAVGDPQTGVIIVLNGQNKEVGGTSASTPIWAGLMALVNQGRLQAGSPSLGLLPPRLYQLAGTANLRDVTKGNNGGYKAGIGYDLTTGLGSPVMSQLFNTLLNQP